MVPSDCPPSICYIALESTEYLKPPGCHERFSILGGGLPPKIGVLGSLRGAKVVPSDSPPFVC